MKIFRAFSMLMGSLLLIAMVSSKTSHANPTILPNPILYITSTESYTANGKNFVRYRYDVLNKTNYPAAMFAASPELPPCGRNTKASRTWVDFFDMSGKLLYGFCALGKPDDLEQIWFALEENVIP